MKIGTVTYIPPPGICNSQAFYDNISRVKAKHPLYLFSDSPKWNPSQIIKWPDFGGKKPPWTINNWIFLTSIKIAKAAGLDYFLFMESDSRVADRFDEIVFDEFFGRYPDGISCAGSIVCWDLNSGGRMFALRVIEEAREYQRKGGLPASFYSGRDPRDCGGSAYYVNGSCAVYQTQAMLNVFAGFDSDIVNYAKRLTAFDLALGRALWNYHGQAAVDHVGWLVRCYSAFGNCITTEKERLEMLVTGSKVAIHQVKGAL